MIRRVLTARTAAPAGAGLALAPDVVLAVVDDGSSRLLDLGGTFFTLTPVATDLLAGALAGPRAGSVAAVAARYRAAPDRVAADAADLFAGLERDGLVRPASGPLRSRRSRLAAAVVARVLRVGMVLPARVRAGLLLGLAFVAFRRLGWPTAVAAWAAASARPGRPPVDAEGFVARTDATVRAAANRHVLNVECKERAVVCWALLRAAGVPAELVVGIDLYPFASHCWCESGGRVLTDFPDRVARYTAVARYA